MRRSAVIDTARGLSLHDHVGWVFEQPADFRANAGQFLADGLAARERILYVGGAGTATPLGLDGLAAAIAGGQAEVTSIGQMYSAGEPIEPERQVDRFFEAADQALADGWTGLRIAADVTSLVRTDRQRAAWIRYEHLADAFIARRPVAGLCGFDRTVLDRTALAEATCPHAALTPGGSEFRLYATGGPAAELALAGEIDPDNRRVLAAVLRHARPAPRDGRLTVDATALAFVDHRGLALLAAYANRLGVTAVLRARAESVPKMIADLVPMGGLEVQVVSA
ncbi:MEDS domain-containing protein [Actinoplanes sp. L3-i22]|uniref:MEDS domain-containing protein n=1 Tax=Actinoplanes sp. L3-i22 TaxID=2836373 RepID=UPI001C798558|nr:MEDS domain-containing protein [Actinoplanes sp. L3-i22]BCY10702.1 hypothetical protein L3i22_057900 [Actinoplanes sp. L3-i22]